jgi:hypothetical protein
LDLGIVQNNQYMLAGCIDKDALFQCGVCREEFRVCPHA